MTDIKYYINSNLEVGLVACTKSKRTVPSIPKKLYMASDLFQKRRRYCEIYHHIWYILSAKHHLLEPDGPEIEPYNETLKKARKEIKVKWSEIVFKQLKEMNLLHYNLIIHAGKDYYEYLIPLLKNAGVTFSIPTAHLGIGEQKAWYKEMIEKSQK